MSLNLTGNNLIPYPYYNSSPKTVNGITFTVNNDGSVTANGTSTATANFLCLSLSSLPLKKGEYTLSSGLIDNTSVTYGITFGYKYENSNRTSVATKNGYVSIILTENAMCDVVITVRANQTLDNLIFFPMLSKGTTALPYEPYKNINPENIRVNMSSNLIPYPYKTSTTNIQGVDFTVNEDGSVLVNGTNTSSTSYIWFQLTGDISFKEGTPCFLSGCPEGGSFSTYKLRTASLEDTGNGALINKTVPKTQVYIVIGMGITVENLVFKPMLNKGTTALPYEKYIAPKDVEKVVVAKSPNLLNYANYSNRTIQGIIYTANDDGTITANGTATADSYYYLTKGYYIALKAGTYTVSGCPEGGSKNTYAIVGAGWVPLDIGEGSTFTLEEDANKSIMIFIKKGTTVENLTFYPMLTKNNNPNIFPYPYQNSSMTQGGLTFTDNRDGTITVNGTSTKAMDFYYWNYRSPLKVNAGENYFVDGCPASGGGSKYYQQIFLYNSSGVSITSFSDTGAGANITVPENAMNLGCKIYINSGQTFDNVIFKPRVIKTEVLPYQKYDREVVWSKNSGSNSSKLDEFKLDSSKLG